MLNNIECEFSYRQKVKIISGLYAGKYGKFKRLDKDRYIIEVQIDDNLEEISCSKKQVIKQKTWFGK
jgi:transcription antitermination factor NusG